MDAKCIIENVDFSIEGYMSLVWSGGFSILKCDYVLIKMDRVLLKYLPE